MTLLVVFLLTSSSLFATNFSYIDQIMPMKQDKIKGPRRINSKWRYEGCGPVALAMLFGHYELKHQFELMEKQDHFNGTTHPSHTIKKLYKKSFALKTPFGGKQTFTIPDFMYKTVKNYSKQYRQLSSHRMRSFPFTSKKKRFNKIKSIISKGNPVLTLIHHIPGCLNYSRKKSSGWHYVLLNGFNDDQKEFYLISGWQDRPYYDLLGPQVHSRINKKNKALIKCSYEEMMKTDPALYWIDTN